MATKDELPRGQLSNIILSILSETDKYGYEIIETVKEKTNNSLIIKQPSLYSCLRRMENQNLISSYWRDSDIGGRRHYYSITDYGKKYAEKWNADFNISQFATNDDNKTKEDYKKDYDSLNQKDSSTILQQTSLISNDNINKEDAKKENDANEPENKNDTFVQYNLFSSPTYISEPSNEVFDCIKKLRESADDEQKPSISLEEEDKLSFLRNEPIVNTEAKIETSYVADNYNVNNNTSNVSDNDVKKTFFEFSKKQKSFANTLKENPDIISYNNKEYDNQEFEPNSLNSLSLEISNNTLNKETDLDKHLNSLLKETSNETLNETSNQKEETTTILEDDKIETEQNQENNEETNDMPTIYQTTSTYKDTDDEAYYEDDSNNIEFIDLNNLDFSDNEKAKDAINSDVIFPAKTETMEESLQTVNEETDNENSLNNNVQENKVQEDETPENNEEIPKPLNYDKQPISEQKDDAIYITEKPHLEDIPKVKKIAPARFEQYPIYDERLDKRMAEIRHNKELIEQQEYNNQPEYNVEQEIEETIQNEAIETDAGFSQINDFTSLQKYYQSLNIKFDIYNKSINKPNQANYINKHKLNMFSYISISALSILISIIMFCTFKNSQPNLNWMYITIPVFISLGNIYFVTKYLSNKSSITPINSLFNYNWIYMVILTLVGILSLFSINLLCGMTFELTHKFLTSFGYLSTLLCLIPAYSLINYIFIKIKVFKI